MYGMNGKLIAKPGRRGELVAILTQAAALVGGMPGCRLYIVSEDAADETAVWVFEAWDDRAAHDASLQDAGVRALIQQAMPLMGGAPEGTALAVVGGHGLGNHGLAT